VVVVHEDLAIHALTGELYVMALEAEANVDDELGTPPHAGAIHALTGGLYVMALEAEANVDDELGTPPHAGACSLTSSRPERHNIP